MVSILEFKITLGILASILGILAYIPYLTDMYKGKTKPHTFSWLVWTLVVGTAFFGQVADNGGAGAWNTGTGAVLSLVVFLGSLKVGEKNITLSDWLCLVTCLFGMLIWHITDTPLWTMLLVSLVDTIAFIPTFRKAYHKPFSETLSIYYLAAFKMLLGIFALENLSITTVTFPATVITTNLLFATMVIQRRKHKPISI